MTDRSEGEWRWPLPDDWTPSGYWCVCITIPADQQYFDRLTGALGMLTLSKAWYPDPTGQGPEAVAYAWEKALYLNAFQLNENCGVVPSPPIPNEAAANDAAAAIYTVFMQYIVSQLNSCAGTVSACGGCVDSLMADLTPYGAGDAVKGALQRLCSDLNASPTHRAEYETDCPYSAQYDALRSHIAAHPYDWLNSLSDFMFGWLNNTADAILSDMSTVAGLMGFGAQGFVNDHGGIPPGGGASFGTTCPWEAVFDLTALDGGFAADQIIPCNVQGSWVSGIGWESAYLDNAICGQDNAVYQAISITQQLPDATYTGFSFKYDVSCGETGYGGTGGIIDVNGHREATFVPCDGGIDIDRSVNGAFAGTPTVHFAYTAGYKTPSDHVNPGGGVFVKEFRARGTGPNPFA